MRAWGYKREEWDGLPIEEQELLVASYEAEQDPRTSQQRREDAARANLRSAAPKPPRRPSRPGGR